MPCEIAATVRLPVRPQPLVRLVRKVIRALRYDVARTEVSIAFIGDARMRTLNAQYRKKRGTTDVLSFPGSGGDDLGELVISVPQARRQARRYGTTLDNELRLLLVHGILHLAGYVHDTPRQRRIMQSLEQRFLPGSSLIKRSITSL